MAEISTHSPPPEDPAPFLVAPFRTINDSLSRITGEYARDRGVQKLLEATRIAFRAANNELFGAAAALVAADRRSRPLDCYSMKKALAYLGSAIACLQRVLYASSAQSPAIATKELKAARSYLDEKRWQDLLDTEKLEAEAQQAGGSETQAFDLARFYTFLWRETGFPRPRRYVLVVDWSDSMRICARGTSRWAHARNFLADVLWRGKGFSAARDPVLSAKLTKRQAYFLYFANGEGSDFLREVDARQKLRDLFDAREGNCQGSFALRAVLDDARARFRKASPRDESYLVLLSDVPEGGDLLADGIESLRRERRHLSLTFIQVGHAPEVALYLRALRQRFPDVVDSLLLF